MISNGMNTMSRIIFYEDGKNFWPLLRMHERLPRHILLPELLPLLQGGGCFMVCHLINFMGNQYFMRRGEYADHMSMMGMSNCIRSCRMIPIHRGSFRVRIYERENFQGQIHELMEDCKNIMECFSMPTFKSCNVMEGHWLMYEQPHFRGRMMYMRPGDYRNLVIMGMSSIRFMRMRPIMDSCYEVITHNGAANSF